MTTRHAVLLGATGLIGGHLLRALQDDSDIASIKVLVRRSVDFVHPKVETVVLDFGDLDAFRTAMDGCDLVFCAVGTTQKKVDGDRDAYRTVDFDIPVHAARFAQEAGAGAFLVVSSIGADSSSSNFYLRTKGEVEDAITDLDIPRVVIARPSLLLGNRREVRWGERIGALFMQPLSFLLPAHMRPIEAEEVARALISASKDDLQGTHVLAYKELTEYSAQ